MGAKDAKRRRKIEWGRSRVEGADNERRHLLQAGESVISKHLQGVGHAETYFNHDRIAAVAA